MTGVRERKHKETRAQILRAARDLFLGKGWEATTVEQIAAQAVVGVGTLYNYFPSKDDIFLAVMYDEILLNVESARENEDEGDGHGVEEAILRYLTRYFSAVKMFRKNLWKDVMSMAVAKAGGLLFKKLFMFDLRFIASVERKLKDFKKSGHLPETFDCGEASFNIYSVVMTLLIIYMYTDDMTVDDLMARVRKQLHFVFSGRA